MRTNLSGVLHLFEPALSVVFSTKGRVRAIKDSWRARLHEYLGGTARGLGAFAQEIGGVEDHVHLLVGLKATHRLADFMRELKKASSIWVHEEVGDSLLVRAGVEYDPKYLD